MLTQWRQPTVAAVWLLVLTLSGCTFTPLTPPAVSPSSPLAVPSPAHTDAQTPPIETVQIETVQIETVQIEEVRVTHDDVRLTGTLTLPGGAGPFPAVLMLTGSGPQDRNNGSPELPGYAPYAQFAAAFAKSGIASLRLDDRGVGGSTGDTTVATADELLLDADAAFTFLQNRPAIDPARIAVLGHSEGATVAAMLAARRPDVHAVVALAGPALSGYDTVKASLARLPAITGRPEAEVAPMAAQELKAMDLALAEDWEALEAHLRSIMEAQFATFSDEQRATLGDVDALLDQLVADAMARYRNPRFRYDMQHNPAAAWSQVNAPVLALFAQHETTVFADVHRPALADALAHNENVTLDVVPGVNHLFLAADTGDPRAWSTLEPDVPPSVVARVVVWLETQLN